MKNQKKISPENFKDLKSEKKFFSRGEKALAGSAEDCIRILAEYGEDRGYGMSKGDVEDLLKNVSGLL